MTVYLTKEFLSDLRESRDVRFVDKVLSRAINEDGSFSPDREDHRYDGIKDAWIRYVTRGTTAYRVIFIRKGPDIFLYRCGGHSVEDNLTAPTDLSGACPVASAPAEHRNQATALVDNSCYLKTSEAKFISRHIESMYHVRHKEIQIVSPFIDLDLLSSQHAFGRFLDRAIEEGTVVVLLTAAEPHEDHLAEFRKFEERDINCFFLPGLHSKLYVFDVDLSSRQRWQHGVESHAIVGSSNLTSKGLGFNDAPTNVELNCRVPTALFLEAKEFVYGLMKRADDYVKYAQKMRRRRPQ